VIINIALFIMNISNTQLYITGLYFCDKPIAAAMTKSFTCPVLYFVWFVSFLTYSVTPTFSQVINGYAEVSSITGTTINLANVDEGSDTFEDGEYIVIMQMQDNVIGNTTNTSSFGDLGSILSAGLYEIRVIASHTESAGTPTSIDIQGSFANSYNTGANSAVQIITFPTLGSPNYTTAGNMAAKVWDGTTGGVLCFRVDSTLTLAHDLSTDTSGFRGAGNDIGTSCGGGVCEDTEYISTHTSRALKGEGIYLNTTAGYEAARGKILNGGGGGSCHNGAGGGGGNYTAGGEGGIGWGCQSVTPRSAGGLGGIALSTEISASRVFMGGGGGSGERNNNHNTSGGNGGGIILIQADEIITTGSCGGINISSNGESTPDIGNDGAGGAGAGGSIVIQVNTWNIASTCPITISANGGDGGSSLSGGVHGGGGGGGQGVVIFSIAAPSSNTTIETINGTGGCGNNSSPCNSQASPGQGSSGSGVIGGSTGPLPVELLSFKAQYNNDEAVVVRWSTSSEINNDYFTILRAEDAENWSAIGNIDGAGNSSRDLNYEFLDQNPLQGYSYYRLQQTDFNGDISLSSIDVVFIQNNEEGLLVYPNPTSSKLYVDINHSPQLKVKLINYQGQIIYPHYNFENGKMVIDVHELNSGIYIFHLEDSNIIQHQKVIIR